MPSVVKMVAFGVAFVLLSYTWVSSLADRRALQHTLDARGLELDAAEHKIEELQERVRLGAGAGEPHLAPT